MKKMIKRIAVGVLAGALAIGSVAGVAYAKEYNIEDEVNGTFPGEMASEENVNINEDPNADKYEEHLSIEDEVVYVFTNADGSVRKIMDSVWIEEGMESEKSAEEADLPLEVKITYFLDGKEISADDIAGKCGHVKVRFDFLNTKYEYRMVNGENRKVYVPFIAATMAVLDGECFDEVTVSSGKTVYDGARYAVMGITLPGVKEDIDLNFEGKDTDFDIPEYIEMEADTTNCDLSGMYLIVSNSVFNEFDVDTSGYLDDLQDNIDKITDAMQQLMDGSSKLYDGLGDLLDGTNKLSDGVTKLSDGLTEIDSNSDALVDGAKKVFNTLLDTVSKQMSDSGIPVGKLTIDNYDEILGKVIEADSVSAKAREKVAAEVNANREAVEKAVKQAVKESVTEQVIAQYRAGVVAAIAAEAGAPVEYVEANMAELIDRTLASKQGEIDATIDAQMESEQVEAIISAKTAEQSEALINQYMASEEVKSQISDGLGEIKAARASLNEYNNFYKGIIAYTDGVGEACNGALEIKKNMPELIDGVKTLREGEGKLSDGLKEFNEEGVAKIVDLVDDTLEGMIEKFDVMTSVSKNYRTYDAEGEIMKEGVKFIYKVN